MKKVKFSIVETHEHRRTAVLSVPDDVTEDAFYGILDDVESTLKKEPCKNVTATVLMKELTTTIGGSEIFIQPSTDPLDEHLIDAKVSTWQVIEGDVK